MRHSWIVPALAALLTAAPHVQAQSALDKLKAAEAASKKPKTPEEKAAAKAKAEAEKAKAEAEQEAREMLSKVQADEEGTRILSEVEEKGGQFESVAVSNLDRAVEYVLERVIGKG